MKPVAVVAVLALGCAPVQAQSQGDIVTLVFERQAPDPQDPSKNYKYNSIDIFRVLNGKIAEHWDGSRKDPPHPQEKK